MSNSYFQFEGEAGWRGGGRGGWEKGEKGGGAQVGKKKVRSERKRRRKKGRKSVETREGMDGEETKEMKEARMNKVEITGCNNFSCDVQNASVGVCAWVWWRERERF